MTARRKPLGLAPLMLILALSAILLAACSGTAAEPTEPPLTTEPTQSATTAPVGEGGPFAGMSRDEFEQATKDALTSGDAEAAAQLMTDPFIIGFYQSESSTLSPIEAATEVTTTYKFPECTLDFPAAPADITERMGGLDPRAMWDPTVTIASTVYSTGWGLNCTGEGFLVFAEQPDASIRWYSLLLAPDGFNPDVVEGGDGSGAAGTPVSSEGTSTLEGIQTIVKDAVTNRDFELMALAMADTFGIGFWRSEGLEQTPIEAADNLTANYLGENCEITYAATAPEDLAARMDNMDPLSFWAPDANIVGMLYSTGWGATCTDEALLFFNQSLEDGSFAWYSILLAPGGFQ